MTAAEKNSKYRYFYCSVTTAVISNRELFLKKDVCQLPQFSETCQERHMNLYATKPCKVRPLLSQIAPRSGHILSMHFDMQNSYIYT